MPGKPTSPAEPVLLSGGNPQIAKGDGDAPVQAYIAAMPGWKSEAGRRLDALVTRTVPGVRKAVKWNSPFYGVEGQGWFLSFHCYNRYLKLAFFRGASLDPVAAGRVQGREHALFPHPRGGRARRGAAVELDPAGVGAAWLGPLEASAAAEVAGGNIRDSASRFLQIAMGIATGTKAATDMATDWRGETLARVRALMKEADSEMTEEVKWRKASNNMQGVPVWERGGIICTGETYKDKVKLTFARGAALEDPSGLFNSSLEGNMRRAIDMKEGEEIDEAALKALIRAAVALNLSGSR